MKKIDKTDNTRTVHFIEGVYSEHFHLVQRILSALLSVRFMIVRFIETL